MRRFVSYAKIMQTESIDASLLASYADVQLILCKDNANLDHRCKLACKLCRGAAYLMQIYAFFIVWRKNSAWGFVLLTNCLDLSRFFLFMYHDFNLLE